MSIATTVVPTTRGSLNDAQYGYDGVIATKTGSY